jgi:hypothetical protein
MKLEGEVTRYLYELTQGRQKIMTNKRSMYMIFYGKHSMQSKFVPYLKVASNIFSSESRNIHQLQNFLGDSLCIHERNIHV